MGSEGHLEKQVGTVNRAWTRDPGARPSPSSHLVCGPGQVNFPFWSFLICVRGVHGATSKDMLG